MSTITRRRRSSDDMPDEERNTPKDEGRSRSRRSRSRDEEPKEERPRSRRSRGSSDEEEKPRGRRQRASSSSSSGGWGSYQTKRRASSSFADDFKPKNDDEPNLIKVVDAEPFAIYNQHWIDEVGKGEKKSYVCYDDPDVHEDYDKGCPLCEIGDNAKTFTLWNVVDLHDPRKAELKVWNASVSQSDDLQRMSESHRTSPLNREDLYLEVTRIKKGNNTRYKIEAVKAEDVEDDPDYGADYLLDADEIAEYEEKRFDSLDKYLKVDSWDDLDELAEKISR